MTLLSKLGLQRQLLASQHMTRTELVSTVNAPSRLTTGLALIRSRSRSRLTAKTWTVKRKKPRRWVLSTSMKTIKSCSKINLNKTVHLICQRILTRANRLSRSTRRWGSFLQLLQSRSIKIIHSLCMAVVLTTKHPIIKKTYRSLAVLKNQNSQLQLLSARFRVQQIRLRPI